jgi:predicted lysophospholipase L1 biosynthesis ABC-type transport system permease subunit
MFSVQNESYRLLKNIGLISKTAKRSILWQILIFTLLGQAIGGSAIWICGISGISRIEELIKYLPVKYIAGLSAVHLLISLAASAWVTFSLGKQIYPFVKNSEDINLEVEEQEVVS